MQVQDTAGAAADQAKSAADTVVGKSKEAGKEADKQTPDSKDAKNAAGTAQDKAGSAAETAKDKAGSAADTVKGKVWLLYHFCSDLAFTRQKISVVSPVFGRFELATCCHCM